MKVVFASKTGNVKRFIKKTSLDAVQVSDGLIVKEPYILVTYTTRKGQVPDEVASFLRSNYQYLRGVAASGNKNWGDLFALSADKIAAQYSVPILMKFELAGTPNEVATFIKEVASFEAH